MGCGPTFTFASNAYWYQKHECGWRGDWKKRGRGRRGEERAERRDRKSTSEESHKGMFSSAQPEVFCRKGFPDGGLLSTWRAASSYRNRPVDVWLDSSPHPLLRPRCALWVHDDTEISLALWIETSHFPVLICPLLSSCALVPWTTRTILDCVRLSMVESLCVSYLLISRFLLFHSVFLCLSKVILLYF